MAVKFFPWEDKYSVNSEILDEQHKRLFSITNELYDAFTAAEHKEKIGDIIQDLYSYTVYHFDDEEKIIQRTGNRLSPDHLMQHDDFIKKISEVKEKHAKGKTMLTYGLMTFLRKWLIEHIMNTDQKYAKMLSKSES